MFSKPNQFILLHTLVASLVFLIFVFTYARPLDVVPRHIGLVAALYTGIVCLAMLMPIKHRLLSVLLYASLTSALVLIYTANFFSNYYWNDNLTLSFIWLFLNDLTVLLEDIPFGLTLVVTIFVSIFAASAWFYWRRAVPGATLKAIGQTKLAVLLSAVIVVDLAINFSPTDPGQWEGELLSNLAVKRNTLNYYTAPGAVVEFEGESALSPEVMAMPNIVLIHADALRADHLSSMGYERQTTPFLETLHARGSEQVHTGLSICSESVCGILSVLAGKFFKQVDVDTPKIHSYLKNSGYRVVFSGSGALSWEGLDQKISHDVDHFFRSEFDENFSINDDGVILDSLNRMPDYSGHPTFFFLQQLEPQKVT